MRWDRLFSAAAIAVTILVSGEVAARADDWVRLGIPFGRTPNDVVDLRQTDSMGIHGRPFGRYHQFQLNNFGFRGPDMAPLPPPGCTRILVLGASETMGYYESPGHEYPAQLRDSLKRYGCYEVVNAGIPGSTVKALISHWEHYANRFGAQLVLIYPSPSFYIGVDPPTWPKWSPNAPARTADWSPRLLDRLHNVLHTPDFIQIKRERKWIADDTRGKPASWFFSEPPEDRLEKYATDLDSLVKSVRASGALPILMTHAMRFTIPAQPADDFLLIAWHHFAPRALPAAMLAFEHAASLRTRGIAEMERVPLVDIDSAVSGRSEFFGDFIHFTDDGSAHVAGEIARTLASSGLISLPSGVQKKPAAQEHH